MAYGGLSMLAQVHLARGVGYPGYPIWHVRELREAAAVFPLDHINRSSAVNVLITFFYSGRIPPQMVIAAIDKELADDPYAADLLRDRQILLAHEKQANMAEVPFLRVEPR